jgi:hypothetical protein
MRRKVMKRPWTFVLLVTVLFASLANAEDVAIPLSGVELVTNPDGRVQLVLLCSAPVVPEHVSLGDAWLRLPGLPLSEIRDLRIHVRAVSGPWAPGGEIPVHEHLVGRLSLPRGAAATGIDLTNLVRGLRSAEEFYGFLVTTPEGSEGGFDGTDAPLLLAAFEQASLEMSHRRIPPPPRRQS